MLADQANLGHWLDQVRLNADDLKLVGCNPSSSLDVHRIDLFSDLVAMHAIGPLLALAEMYQPAGLFTPIAQAFALHDEVVPHAGVKDERQRYEAGAGNLVGIIGQRRYVDA